jgi:hypothetical protein
LKPGGFQTEVDGALEKLFKKSFKDNGYFGILKKLHLTEKRSFRTG